MLAFVFRTDDSFEAVQFTNETAYQTLRDGVGGLIECVSLPNLGIDMWVNDEGKLNGSEPNLMGTLLWSHAYGFGTDIIYGDIVLTGSADDEGNTLGLSQENLIALYNLL